MKTNKQRGPISALQLRMQAGCAPERRGSALLIVIGTLALVAVFAAVYVSIGRTDRRAANALKTRIEQQDTSNQIGEYLAGVIGDDRLDAFVQYDFNGNPFALREATDAPYTDWTRRSEAVNGDEFKLFTPTGRPFEIGSLLPSEDYRVANDPWLSSTKPTYLGFPGDPLLGPDERQFSIYEEFDSNYPNEKNFLEQRDWLQISNFAPDGRPVNLYNLRPNVPNGAYGLSDVGGFDAEPGFGTSRRADGRDIRRMSNFLSLLNVETKGDANSLLKAFDPAVDGVWVPGYNDPQVLSTFAGTDDLYNTPAVWTMYQRFMFMPLNQQFVIKNRLGNESTWADPDFPAYQYADADGDGFADSRWFELRAARDATQGGLNTPREDIQQLFEQDDMRFFIAARAVDLSSMVNVNTATDSLVTPTIEYPLGLTPAEVDLRRLLTMQDPASDYTSAGTVPLSMQAAPRPQAENPNYGWPRSWKDSGDLNNVARNVQDYNYYQMTTDPSVNGDLRELESNSPAVLIGRYAYDALRRAKALGGTLNDQYWGVNLQVGGVADGPTDLVQYPTSVSDPTDVPGRLTAEQRYQEYMSVGREFSVNPGLASASGQLYGLDDLGELLTYHGLNDPDYTSRLERVVTGRYKSETTDVSSDDPLLTRRMSPLLSNRDLTLDRYSHGRILAEQNADMRRAPAIGDNATDLSRIGEISHNAMALMALTPRKLLTTVSGHVPFSPDKRYNLAANDVYDASLPMSIDTTDALPALSEVITDASALFDIYSKSLAANLEDMRGQSWSQVVDLGERDNQLYSTLFYGHRGPELALRIAAHNAVNTKDLMDSDQTPTVATLLIDNDLRPDLKLGTNPNFADDLNDSDPSDPWYRDFPGRAAGLLFDPAPEDESAADTVLADGEFNAVPRRQAVNVYGMEAMPIITEVSTFFVYTDAPELVAGSSAPDFLNMRPSRLSNGVVGPIPQADQLKRITINGDLDYDANPDYLMQCIAFQLYNPFDEPISLGGSGMTTGDPLTRMREHDDQTIVDASTDQYQYGYYIEYNGHFFKLAEFERYYASDSSLNNHRGNDSVITGSGGTFNNPADDFPIDGGYLDPATYPDFVARNVVLQPGETRVFYAVGDHRYDVATNNLLIDQRWLAVLEGNDAYDFDARPWNDVTTDDDGDLIPDFDLDEDGLADGKDGKGWTGPAQEFVTDQLSPGNAPVLIHPMDPQTGEYLSDAVVYDFLTTPGDISSFNQISGSPTRQDPDEVRLWLKITTPGEEENDPAYTNRITENLLHNDMLVDRMGISGSWGTGIAEPLLAGEQEIEGTTSFPEDYPDTQQEIDAQVRNDNTGYTIMRWASTRRRKSGDPAYDGNNFDIDTEEIGQIREWMLSSRLDPELSVIGVSDDYSPTPTIEDFREVSLASDPAVNFSVGYNSASKTDYEVWRYLITMFQGPPVVVTASQPPYRKDDLDNRFPGNGDDQSEAKFDDSTGGLLVHPDGATTLHAGDTVGLTMLELDYAPDNMRPQLAAASGVDTDHPRLADLLLSMGISPTYSRDISSPSPLAEYHAEDWITFPEALAIALGYEQPTASASNNDTDAVWADTWRVSTDRDQRLFDDGRLALDRFVPFVNIDPTENPNEFDAADDILRGAGVPLAAGVVDRARSIARQERSTDHLVSNSATLDLTRPIFGTININTAPVEVLRLLPGLSPSRSQYINSVSTSAPEPEWWGADTANYPNLRVPNLVASSPALDYDELRESPDIAAAIVAYRDRTYGMPNTAARPEPGGEGSLANAPFYLSVDITTNLDTVGQNMIGELPPTTLPGTGNTPRDRSTMTGINGLRSTPGFGSLGELFAVRADPDYNTNPGGTPTAQWGTWRHLSIDQLGYDERSQGIDPHVDGSSAITMLPEVFSDERVGSTVDDYAEKLAIANGVLNMLSVRSDYYAVWFVVQGYRESDVANLRPEDPLIPSLYKRYIMVIDRSNVIEAGDQPNIVLLKEVPL
ncbi:MAG: hypothetical protein CMJ35_07685 [Phycisphaerae bacterium]|nr:hypothetical protein [Phycisphaerae bacterium]MBM91482.1 hypothetical protein [Phycisphaerae bacterium]